MARSPIRHFAVNLCAGDFRPAFWF